MFISKSISTRRQATTIDALFGRFVNHLSSDTYVLFVSYYKPIVTVLKNVTNEIDENLHTCES